MGKDLIRVYILGREGQLNKFLFTFACSLLLSYEKIKKPVNSLQSFSRFDTFFPKSTTISTSLNQRKTNRGHYMGKQNTIYFSLPITWYLYPQIQGNRELQNFRAGSPKTSELIQSQAPALLSGDPLLSKKQCRRQREQPLVLISSSMILQGQHSPKFSCKQ